MTQDNPMKDRNYYRTMHTRELLDETRRGRDVDWQELAIALADRLEDKQRVIDTGGYGLFKREYD